MRIIEEQNKHAIFMMGLPGSGKTTWIDNNINKNIYDFVSADEIRLAHPRYDARNPELIHEECVKNAEQKMYEISDRGFNVVMDGGGINKNYTLRIIKTLKEKGYKIDIVFINTPVQICLDRNVDRKESKQRFVPASSIIHKAYKLNESIEKLKPLCDNFIEVEYFTNTHIFCDMDGTVAEYQNLPCDEYGDVNFVGYGVFGQAKPVMEVINKLKMLSEKGHIIHILSASPNNIANKEKMVWLKKYMPFIEEDDIHFAGNKDFKHVFLRHLLEYYNIDRKDCMVIDDDHKILERERLMLVNAIHPSKFLTDF